MSDVEEDDCEELPEGLVQRRAAFDIGSGSTKLMIADVDVETGQLGDIVHASERTVKYAFDWKTHGVLSDAVQAEGIKVLHALRTEVLASGCTAYTAIATEVFRKAPNGAAFLQRVRAELGLEIALVSQEEEAQIGFRTAVAVGQRGRAATLAWDSGGGSFQLSARVGGGGVRVYAGPLGNADAFARLRDMGGATSQNVKAVIAALTEELPPAPAWLAAALQEGPAVAFGHRSSCFRVACDAIGASGFAPEDVKRATAKLVSLGDDGARADWLQYVAQGHAHVVAPLSDRQALDEPYPEPHLALAKLVLVAAVMAKLNVERVEYHETNGSCLEVLLHEPFWD